MPKWNSCTAHSHWQRWCINTKMDKMNSNFCVQDLWGCFSAYFISFCSMTETTQFELASPCSENAFANMPYLCWTFFVVRSLSFFETFLCILSIYSIFYLQQPVTEAAVGWHFVDCTLAYNSGFCLEIECCRKCSHLIIVPLSQGIMMDVTGSLSGVTESWKTEDG